MSNLLIVFFLDFLKNASSFTVVIKTVNCGALTVGCNFLLLITNCYSSFFFFLQIPVLDHFTDRLQIAPHYF